MKLVNKKTGEIGTPRVDYQEFYVDTENGYTYNYKSLQRMYEEWEDYEEPKTYWFIDPLVTGNVRALESFTKESRENIKELGFDFETREETEKAVEKLKAWKRLKDGGITFKNWTINQTGTIDCFAAWGDNIPPSRKNPTLLEDLDLLFGGKE